MSSNSNANHQANHHNYQSNLDHDLDPISIRSSSDGADDKAKEDCPTADPDPNNTNNENRSKCNKVNGNSKNDNVTNQTTQANKVERIEECINQCLSDKSKKKISNIINNVIELTDIEKVYLYLKLPTGASQETEKFKLKSNAFGKNKADSEVSKTYIWIKSHLEEDSSVSLPKHEVYEEYKLFCETNLTQPICQADFGKLMKHMFPSVKPRRLGQRGNSRYCYSGLRKKVNFDKPTLPDVFSIKDNENNEKNKITRPVITTRQQSDQQLNSQINNDKHKIESASSYLVLEWARKLLNLELTSIKELAKHLILLNHIDKKSMAALTVIGSDDTNDKDEFRNFHDSLNDQTNNLDELDQSDSGSLLKGRKVLENVKIKTKPDALKLLNSTDTSPIKKEKQQRIKKLDKELLKLNYANKKQTDTCKLPKILKIKKTKIKKENLKCDKSEKLKQQTLTTSALNPLNPKIKLESFDNITNKFAFNNESNSSLSNPIEINKTKNLIQEDNNQFIDNTQQFKSSLDFGLKRRHSTTGFIYSNQRTDQLDNTLITDDINYKYQIKRQTSEQFDLNKKRLNLNQFSTDDLNLQSTNYLTNESTAKNNQLAIFKKYNDLKLDIANANLNSNLLHENDKQQLDNRTNGNANLLPTISESINANNPHNQTISTQVDEQELYRFNNLFENGNQTALNQNQALINPPLNNLNQGNLLNYNETTATNMCNVNTQIPSIPASPINSAKDNSFAGQFTANQMINDKVDFNNNNLSNAGVQSYAVTQNTLAYTDDQIQMNNGQLTNQLTDQHKMFMNSSAQNLHNFLNKNQIANARPLTRVRHSSGPSHSYSMLYNSANSFLPSTNLNNISSNSLSPLYENSIDNQKTVSFQNMNNHHSMKFNFASNPASPVSEPISPIVNSLTSAKKLANLRFNKFGNLGQPKKDGTRSASFACSNSSEPFASFNRTRNRHMSSPYILTPNDSASLSNNFSNSTQSLTGGSLTNSSLMTPQNTPTTLPFNSDVFIPQQQQNNALVGMIDDSNNLNNNQNMTMNNMSINLLNSNQTNLNLQDNYGSIGTTIKPTNYEYPLSPPLTSNILSEEKSFTSHLSVMNMNSDLQQPTATRPKNFSQSIQEFNRDLNGNNPNLLNNNIRQSSMNEPIDDVLQDLKDLKYIE